MKKPLDVLKKDVTAELINGISKLGRINVKWLDESFASGRTRARKHLFGTDSNAQFYGVYGWFVDWDSDFVGKKELVEYKDRLDVALVKTLFANVDENDIREVLIVENGKPVAVYLGVCTMVMLARDQTGKAYAEAGEIRDRLKKQEKTMTQKQLARKARFGTGPRAISVMDLRKDLFRIIRDVERGKMSYVITRNAKPVVKIVPME